MRRRGIAMIDAIQGPPRWDGPDVLLRQTSFRALAEPRRFREPDGSIVETALRVRFGEVEARGIALTRAGRRRYDELGMEVARARSRAPDADPAAVAAACWNAALPATEAGLATADLAYFRWRPTGRGADGQAPPADVAGLLAGGWVTAVPIVYEDFLPQSAAGIFQSNLTGDGAHDDAQAGAALDAGWMAGVLDRELLDPFDLYDAQRAASLEQVRRALGSLPPPLPGADRR
jgi:uncharacterized glyoxalase superfamily metalloenzyme YdcJ